MAWLALVAQVGGSVMSAQGKAKQADAQADQFTQAADQDDKSADTVQNAGYQTARRMRTAGQSTVGQANASLAASGVSVDSKTAQDVRTHITQNAETDALNTILNADSKATNLRLQADNELLGANDAREAGRNAVKNSLLSSFGSAASSTSNWKTSAGSGSGGSSMPST